MVSERVLAAVNGVAARVEASVGATPTEGPARYAMTDVTPDDVARRIVSGLVELEDVEPLLDHLEVRVRQLLGSRHLSAVCTDGEWAAAASTIFMSELQCVAVGVALARAGNFPVAGITTGPAPAGGDPGFVV